jgi:hypothetical protein
MNFIFQGLRFELRTTPTYDWYAFGSFYDSQGNFVGTFDNVDADGNPQGTSIFTWFTTQDVYFQEQVVQQFSLLMAGEIANGVSE